MKSKYLLIWALILILIVSIINAQSVKSFIVIVNNDNNTENISKDQLSKIFLKKVTQWNDGSGIIPIDQRSDAKVRINFSESIHGKNVQAIKAFWQKQIFSGSSVPPVEKISDEEVIKYVKQNPGAIGYVSTGADIQGVKSVKVSE